MSACSHINDTEKDIDYTCAEWWEEEGCDFSGVVEAKGCSASWYVTCPQCGKELESEHL